MSKSAAKDAKLYHTGTGAQGVCNKQQAVKCNQWINGFQSGAQQAVKCNQWMKNGFQSGTQQAVKCNQWMKNGFQSGTQQAVKCNQWMKNGFQSGAQQAAKCNQWMKNGFQSGAHLSIAAQQCDVTLHAAKASSAKVLVYWNYWHYCNCNEIARVWSPGWD